MAASYPGAAKSFSARAAGQTISAAHVNDLQDEVAAIESGLLNGTALLNSSAATVATLQSGASTLTTLQAGASTFTVRPVMPLVDAVRVAGASSEASSVVTVIAWTVQTYITNSSMHSTATASSCLVPQSTGLYEARAQVNFNANSTGSRQVMILDSSGARIAFTVAPTVPTAGVGTYLQAVGTKYFNATGGHLKVATAFGDIESSVSLSTSADTWFEMRKI